MAYYERADSYYDYDDYHSDSRRNSNSFSEDINVAKRKKTNWGGRGRGGGNRQQFNRSGGSRTASSARNITIDTPLYAEPRRTSLPPRRIPQPQNEGRKRGRERANSYRSNAKAYFDIREIPDFIEPEHSGPMWHWDNYVRGCKNWQDKHKLAYYQSRCSALEFENQMLFEQINKLIQENVVFAAERGITPTMEVPEIPGSTTPEKRASSSKNQGKEKIEKEKAAKGTKAEGGSKPPAQKRKDELEQLYGENSTLIHGLETSLMLNFNRNCDTHKPELYPVTPLNSQSVVA